MRLPPIASSNKHYDYKFCPVLISCLDRKTYLNVRTFRISKNFAVIFITAFGMYKCMHIAYNIPNKSVIIFHKT